MVAVYAVLVGFHRSKLALWLATSNKVAAVLGVAYVLLLAWQLAPGGELAPLLRGAAAQAQLGVPEAMAALGAVLRNKAATCLAWVHLLLLDYWMAREVFLDGREAGVPTPHSLVLCFMVGPLGLLSHLLTKALLQKRT